MHVGVGDGVSTWLAVPCLLLYFAFSSEPEIAVRLHAVLGVHALVDQ
jgi:hypothetical protein